MEHNEAIQSRAAERYSTGQMPPDEAELFEAHFFGCLECAEEVRWISLFEANAKQVVGRNVRETDAQFVAVVVLVLNQRVPVTVPSYAQSLVFSIPVSPGWGASHVSLATAAGTARFTMAVPEAQLAVGSVTVMVAAREMDPGFNLLTLVSADGDQLDYPFDITLS
ncbi:MAG: hypothetical protein NTV70_25960 [Acidobacteria bacterium]|nr:hypothetical protein [Acidobacteriota bacterium]